MLIRYCLVGGLAAAIHLGLLIGLARLGLPVPLANLSGYLAALLWGYLMHALLTFRQQTEGERFPRRWLLLQVLINLSLSVGLPQLLPELAFHSIGLGLLVFTPTAVNALVWWLAAEHVRSLRCGDRIKASALQFHADDLGLCSAVNLSIFSLADRGLLQGTSVMLNGVALNDAIEGLRQRPQLNLVLHLVLTEGPPLADPCAIPSLLDHNGQLQVGVAQLMLLSLWPRRWDWPALRQQRYELRQEIHCQLKRFQELWPQRPLQLDGHQHVHLLPVVWDQLMAYSSEQPISWIRTVDEPIPVGLTLQAWWSVLCGGGWLKWLLLVFLSRCQRDTLISRGISTNRWFAGVLCTGRMGRDALKASVRSLRASQLDGPQKSALVLLHPALPLRHPQELKAFEKSQGFYQSRWRQLEAQALESGAEWMRLTK